MERILFGDNQFFAVNHASDEKSRAQSIRFRDDHTIIHVLDQAVDLGITTFMCTTHDRMANICNHLRSDQSRYRNFTIFPCMPYAHKYANAVTELGIMGAVKAYVPGNIIGTLAKGGWALLNNDFIEMMQLLVDAEMKMFKGINTPVIFLQNVIVDLILGLKMHAVFRNYEDYIRSRYNAEPGYITMNMPMLLDSLESIGISNPIICTSVNKLGFRMAGGKAIYEKYLHERQFRPVAMQIMAAGALSPREAVEYIARFPKIESILFGASSKTHIKEMQDLIRSYL